MRLRGADRATGPSCRTELQDRAAGPSYRTELQDRAAGPSYRTELQDRAAGPSYRTELQDRAAGPSCRTELQDRAAGPSYRTELQDRAAGPRTADHRWTTLDHTKAPNDRDGDVVCPTEGASPVEPLTEGLLQASAVVAVGETSEGSCRRNPWRGGCDPPIAPPPTMVKCDMGRRGWKGPNCIGCRQKWQLGMASAVTEHRREEAQQTEVLVSDALVHSTPGSGIYVCGVPVSGAPVSGVPVSGVPVSGVPVSGALIHGWRLDLGSSSRSRICYTYSGVESARVIKVNGTLGIEFFEVLWNRWGIDQRVCGVFG
uniref:Uncharacterized protein n=1 Tax=Knipowitschia caucasica TaxID=637954 RepID=A0AAV2MM29_KNICA